MVLANDAVPADPKRPVHCRLLASQPMSLVGKADVWRGRPGKLVSATDLTSTNAMDFSHTEADSSENGNAMWWVATSLDR